jgi:ribosome-binding factor A
LFRVQSYIFLNVGVLMPFRKVSRRDLLRACAEAGPGDGLDPRYDRPDSPHKVANRKAVQLSGQVADTLALVLAGDADDVLRDLLVVAVTPAPNSSRLLVTVAADADPDAVRGRLDRARARLRGEIASAIHRRRVPDLTFRVVHRS